MRVRLVAKGNIELDAARAVRPQLVELGREILADAERACPVRTGNLRDSGASETDTQSKLTVGFKAKYAAFVSEGTSRQSPNPFFSAALYKSRGKR